MRIVPAVLASEFHDFLLKIRQAESFTDYIQIDLMDGVFVETVSFPAEKINEVVTSLSFEVHLMASDPISFMSKINNRGLKEVIFHFEAEVDHADIISRIKARGLLAGMAIKPETGLDKFRDAAGQADTLLFLTVDPCCYGHPFKPEVLKKVSEARKIFPDKVIAVDGGVSLDNLEDFLSIGVDYVCVGSRIFQKGDPGENYGLFVETLRELESR